MAESGPSGHQSHSIALKGIVDGGRMVALEQSQQQTCVCTCRHAHRSEDLLKLLATNRMRTEISVKECIVYVERMGMCREIGDKIQDTANVQTR